MFQHPVPIQVQDNRHYSTNRSRNSSYKRNRNYSNNRNRSYSNNRNHNYPKNRSRNNSYNRSNYQRSNDNHQNSSKNNSQNRNSSYNNRYRNYSQSPHRNHNQYRSNTPKHQRQFNQVQTNEEITSDPPGIDNTENIELQVNHINCESTDSESDTDNNSLVKMIPVENDYESITYDEPFSSHIYENQLELLNNYYLGPICNDTQTTQEVNRKNTEISLDKIKNKAQLQITYTKIYKKDSNEKKFGKSHFS